eukprot:70761_1
MKNIYIWILTLLTFNCWLSFGNFFECFSRIQSIYDLNDSKLSEIIEDDAFINLFGGSVCVDKIWDVWYDIIPELSFDSKWNILIAYERKDILFFSNNNIVSNMVDFIESSFADLAIFSNERYLDLIDKRYIAISALSWIIKREMKYSSLTSFCNMYVEREEIFNDLLLDTSLICQYNMNYKDVNTPKTRRLFSFSGDRIKAFICNKNFSLNNDDNNKTLDLLNGKKFDKPVAIEFGIGGKYMIGFEYTKGIQIEVKPADRSIHYEKYKLYNVMVGGAGGGIMIRKITINKGGNRFLSSIFRTYSGKAETPTNLGNFGDIKDNKMGEFNFSNGIGDGISNIPGGDVDIKIYDQQMSHLIAKGDGKYIGLTSSPTFLTIGALLNLIDFIPTVTDELTKFMNKYMYVTALFGSSQKVTRGDILLDDILENCDDSNNSIYSNNNTKFIEPVGRYELVSTMYKKSWTSPDNDNGNWSIETSNLKTELLLNIYDEMNENTRYWIGQNVPTSNDWYNYTITATVSFLDDDDEGSIGILFGISEEKAYYFSIESQYVVIGIFTANGYKEI